MHRTLVFVLLVAALCLGLSGCNDGGGGALKNNNPGDKNVNAVIAFGDSITRGTECECPSYPARLSALIGKAVYNTGVGASRATDNVERTQDAINKYPAAFMLILYGINDVIHSFEIDSILGALDQMVSICEENNVLPVLATYPEPIEGRALFAPRVLLLNEGIRDLAKAHGIKCVDLEKEFRANPALYEADGLHPNNEGTQIVALAFADLF